jgi:methylated-DNA-[protein]-cysteine S-methyltransferase
MSFRERVKNVVRMIPRGRTATYQEVAAKAGNGRAARAVGTIMRSNFNRAIPCHRVIRSDGRVGQYNRGGEKEKIARLKREGVKIKGTRVIR